jgi:hypothetical protein
MSSSESELVTQLQEATKDLLWISESEAPFEVVTWPDHPTDHLDERSLLKLTNRTEEQPIGTMEFNQFFGYPAQVQDWHSEEEAAIAHQYQHLIEVLKQYLHDLKVYRIGEVTVDIYILGTTESGHIAGLCTKAVET